ncbi:hypothetical protein CMV_025614 [Castanea mollissima]|uniref:Uncharacterized protein n=1 Tax=Castanea mollissima TaxID=60419 RepID=A0A8J4QE61_9ROSI|nr:hypothetical protein CMV_025614 [Castanea mollissima]
MVNSLMVNLNSLVNPAMVNVSFPLPNHNPSLLFHKVRDQCVKSMVLLIMLHQTWLNSFYINNLQATGGETVIIGNGQELPVIHIGNGFTYRESPIQRADVESVSSSTSSSLSAFDPWLATLLPLSVSSFSGSLTGILPSPIFVVTNVSTPTLPQSATTLGIVDTLPSPYPVVSPSDVPNIAPCPS